MGNPAKNITELLHNYSQGDEAALEGILRETYRELKRIAANYMRKERPNHTLQPTALVHEAYAQLFDGRKPKWENRSHFFAAAAQMMRWILLDHAKARNRGKRGDGKIRVAFDEAIHGAQSEGADVIELDDALKRLAQIDERRARVVELRYFGGLSMEEVAEVVGVSCATVKRDWTLAKAWLYRELHKAE